MADAVTDLYIGETMSPTWDGLTGTNTLGATGYLNAATVTFVLYESDRTTAVAGGDGTLSYVTASDGDYRGTLASTATAALTPGAVYWLKYVAVNGSPAYRGERWEKCRARHRGKT